MAEPRLVNFNARKTVAHLLDLVEPRLAKAGANLVKQCRAQMKAQPVERTDENDNPLGYSRGLDPSKEGEYPKRVDSGLYRSITYKIKKLPLQRILLYGVPRTSEAAPYAARLEFGFVGTDSRGRNINQGPRPYLRMTVNSEKDSTMAILGGKQ